MKHEHLIRLFGHSEFSPEVVELLTQLHVPGNRPEERVCWRNFNSAKWDLSFTFLSKNNYKFDYGPVAKEYIQEYDESILEEINFGGTGKGIVYPYSLPFGLNFGDSRDTVKEKVGIRKAESGQASYGSYLVFYTADYRLMTAFDFDEKLIWVRVKPYEINFLRKQELTRSLKSQNGNLDVKAVDRLTAFKESSPTAAWKERLSDGDTNFTAENIRAIETHLSLFIDQLCKATTERKAAAVYAAVKKLTIAINGVNNKHDGFIETLEREELGAYIHEAVRMTGFQLEDEVDLTEEWREW